LARDNYSFRKFKKEQARKQKREAKLQKKLDKKNMKTEDNSAKTSAEDVDAGQVKEA